MARAADLHAAGNRTYRLSWVGGVLGALGVRRGHRTISRALASCLRLKIPFLYQDAAGALHLARTRDDMHLLGIFGFHRIDPRFLRAVPSSGVIVDVGANIGLTLTQLRRAAPLARFIAVEPVSENAQCLVDLQVLNGWNNVEIVQAAAGHTAGEVDMNLPVAANSGWASVVKTWDSASTVAVPQRQLDEILGEQECGFVKIDVEGYELSVLHGMEGTLRRCRPPVLIELNEPLLHAAGTSSYEVADFFRRHGYALAAKRRVSRTMCDALFVSAAY